jgi:hypothetical protein
LTDHDPPRTPIEKRRLIVIAKVRHPDLIARPHPGKGSRTLGELSRSPVRHERTRV